MSVANWLDSLSARVSREELALLKRAADILEGNIVRGSRTPWYPYRAMCPSKAFFHGIWNWDCAFHAMGASHWDPILAQEQFKAMFMFQLPNGLVPDVVFLEEERIEDEYGKPPVWSWAVEVMDKVYPDTAFLRYAYTRLLRQETFLRSARYHAEDGLYVYSTGATGDDRDLKIRFESGWDNAVRWDDGIEYLYPIDLNCYMVQFYRSMSYIAGRLGFAEDVREFARKEEALAEAVNRMLWDERDRCYYDYDFRVGAPHRTLTPASFMPLFVHIADAKRAAAMHALAADREKLYPGMPTVAYNDPAYSTDYWRGPTWLNVAYFAAKGLYDYGFRETALGIRDEILSWVYADDTIHENYDSKAKRGINARCFGWSAVFVIEFILTMRHD